MAVGKVEWQWNMALLLGMLQSVLNAVGKFPLATHLSALELSQKVQDIARLSWCLSGIVIPSTLPC